MAQRIIIPKGTVNPAETSVIEIPQHCEASNLVVATARPMDMSVRPGSPPRRRAAPAGPGSAPADLQAYRMQVAEQNVSEDDKYYTPSSIPFIGSDRAWSDPFQLRWQTPPTRIKPTPPSEKSFMFSDTESVYDDSPVREKRRKAQVASPPDYFFHFRYGARAAKERGEPRTPEGQGPSRWRPSPPKTLSPTERNWRAAKMKTLEEATDWHDMNAYVQRLEGHMYEHDVKIYQKSRKNLLYNVSKVACDDFIAWPSDAAPPVLQESIAQTKKLLCRLDQRVMRQRNFSISDLE